MSLGNGTHLLIDGRTERPIQHDDVKRFLERCPHVIEMTPLLNPLVYRGDSGGWAGVVVIAESHIAVHSQGTEVHVDIFSCKSFDQDRAIQEAAERLGLVELRHQALQRGWLAHQPASPQPMEATNG